MSIFTNCWCMRGSRKYCPRGSNFDNAFFSWREERWSKCHNMRANIECWLGSLVLFQGIGTSIAMKLYILWIFRGGAGPGPLSPLWIRPCRGQTHIVGIVHTYGVVQLWVSVALYKWSSEGWIVHSRYLCMQIMAVCDRFFQLIDLMESTKTDC